MNAPVNGLLHHIELWVPRLDTAVASFGWLLETLGYERFQDWEAGRRWKLGSTYLVVEESPALTADRHDRRAPGLNHLAFHVSDEAEVERLVAAGAAHGWSLMFAERHRYADREGHYAAYMQNQDGFEVELVAMAEKV
jgi:catechol 2,3-dioxygenase-like lactoylglutathione lyase family enzyme